MVSAASSVAWYATFGALHEAAHVAAAAILGRLDGAGDTVNLLRALFGRNVHLPALSSSPQWEAAFVHHFAWVCSVAWAVAAFSLTRARNEAGGGKATCVANAIACRSDAVAVMVFAAMVTALEAVASDLLRWGPTGSPHNASSTPSDDDAAAGDHAVHHASIFFCGNFGEVRVIPRLGVVFFPANDQNPLRPRLQICRSNKAVESPSQGISCVARAQAQPSGIAPLSRHVSPGGNPKGIPQKAGSKGIRMSPQ
jgi:hypothetical protein